MNQGWRELPIGEILRLEYGKPLDASDRKPDGRYPVYGANGEKDRTDKFYHDKASIIVGRKGSAGEINLTETRFWPLDVTYFVTFDERQYDLGFLFYLLTTLELTKLAKGVKPGINRNEVYSQVARVPPLAEQQRIVGLLDEAFAGIATAQALAEQNQKNCRALFESHLHSVFTNHGEGWAETTVGQACQFSNGLWKGERPPFVRVGVIRNTNFTREGALDDSDIAYLDVETKKFEKRRLQLGDIILEKSGGGPKQPVGRVALFDKEEGLFSFSNFTAALRVREPNKLDYRYLHRFLYWIYVTGVTEGMQSNSTGIRNLDSDAYKAIKLSLPPLAEQERIVELIDALHEESQRLSTLYEQRLAALAALKKSLLHHAFSGKL